MELTEILETQPLSLSLSPQHHQNFDFNKAEYSETPISLLRPPLFFKETNPQPRSTPYGRQLQILLMDKPVYTGKMQWAYLGGAMLVQLTAVIWQHFLQYTQGLLNKHCERLIQCDKSLNLVSQQPDLVLDSPYFDVQASAKGSPTSCFDDLESTPIAQSSSKIGQNSAGLVPEHLLPQAPSPSSVMDLRAIEGNESRGGNSLQAQQSMSMSNLVNHIGHKIPE